MPPHQAKMFLRTQSKSNDLNGPSSSKVNFYSPVASNHAQDDPRSLKSDLSSNLDGPNDLKASASC